MPYVERRIWSGSYLEVDRYYASTNTAHPNRGEVCKTSSPYQMAKNKRNAAKKLTRIMRANFAPHKDLFVGLTHDHDVDERAAKSALKRFLERLRRYRRSNGMGELKYITTTEKQSKWHHHIVINAVPDGIIESLWKEGIRDIKKLDGEETFSALASYLVKDTKPSKKDETVENAKAPRRKHQRQWSSSKNLQKPKVETCIITRGTMLKKCPSAPAGYTLLPDWSIGCDAYGYLYHHCTFAKNTKGYKTQKKLRGWTAKICYIGAKSTYRKRPRPLCTNA